MLHVAARFQRPSVRRIGPLVSHTVTQSVSPSANTAQNNEKRLAAPRATTAYTPSPIQYTALDRERASSPLARCLQRHKLAPTDDALTTVPGG